MMSKIILPLRQTCLKTLFNTTSKTTIEYSRTASFSTFKLGKNKCISSNSHVIQKREFHVSDNRSKTDYYDVLGINRSSSSKDIKKAYYKLAKQYHPDVNKEKAAHTKFQEVSEAYEVLGDDQKKKEYDMFGMSGQGGQQGRAGGQNPFYGQTGSAGGFQGFHSSVDPEELFRKIFGDAGFNMGGFNNQQDFNESNFGFAAASEIQMNLTFQESARGVNKDVNINVTDTCPKCNGSRAEPGTSAVRCHHCQGTGMESVSTGPFVMRTTCRHCYGKRVLIKSPCTECEGKGKTVQRKKVTVPVPAGIEDGQTVRMPVGSKEIFITFKVEKSRKFRREGSDVHTDLAISLAQAVLGGSVRTEGIYDNILINIPVGTSSHTRIRLPGKGISRTSSYGYGDHYVHVKVKVPEYLSKEQKSILLAYAETEKNIDGTVNGLTDTKKGRKVLDDVDYVVTRIRGVANPPPAPPTGQETSNNENNDNNDNNDSNEMKSTDQSSNKNTNNDASPDSSNSDDEKREPGNKEKVEEEEVIARETSSADTKIDDDEVREKKCSKKV